MFKASVPGQKSIRVAEGYTITINEGSYCDLKACANSTIIFSGGVYHFRNIEVLLKSKMLFSAPAEIRLSGKLYTDADVYLGPQDNSNLSAKDIIFYVAGENGKNGGLHELPKSVMLGFHNIVNANFYAPNGTFSIQKGSKATGAFIAKDIIAGRESEFILESYFGSSSQMEKKNSIGSNSITAALPEKFDLLQNFPNPFNPSTTIKWQQPVAVRTTIKIYDVLGSEVKTLIDEVKPAGNYTVEFIANSLASGVYFYRIQSGNFNNVRKMLLIK